MNLTRPWKITIGVLIAFGYLILPVIAVITWLLFPLFGILAAVSSRGGELSPALVLIMIAGMMLSFFSLMLSSFLHIGLMIFFIAHAVKTSRASDILRIVFLALALYVPLIGALLYYFALILPDEIPAWAQQASAPAA
jgi:hypothetical protein